MLLCESCGGESHFYCRPVLLPAAPFNDWVCVFCSRLQFLSETGTSSVAVFARSTRINRGFFRRGFGVGPVCPHLCGVAALDLGSAGCLFWGEGAVIRDSSSSDSMSDVCYPPLLSPLLVFVPSCPADVCVLWTRVSSTFLRYQGCLSLRPTWCVCSSFPDNGEEAMS